MIAAETFFIFETSGSNEDESVDHFIKAITIAGNQKSIFIKRKNDFAKEKNQNDLSGNRTCGNIFPSAGNVLKKDSINIIIPGNKLKEA